MNIITRIIDAIDATREDDETLEQAIDITVFLVDRGSVSWADVIGEEPTPAEYEAITKWRKKLTEKMT